MATNVNLDALIPREDFDLTDPTYPQGVQKRDLSITDLQSDAFLYLALRKPDFQRETSQWNSNKIVDFVESFLTNELIPAVILWTNPSGFTFVIDGAHGLSALIAWRNDDYGNGNISKTFYEGMIPEEQKDIDSKTRVAINKRIGPYSDYKMALETPEKFAPEIAQRARRLGTLAITLQYVNGDASTAESSFFKINQQASPIDKTELKVLKLRRTPIGIAARAIARSGKGHKYWSSFNQQNIDTLEDLARDINALLFKPNLPPKPLKTLDIPIAGESYAAQSLPLIVEFIQQVSAKTGNNPNEMDPDGTETIESLRQCKRIAELISSKDPGSLGLHPAVYFYSPSGRHKLASFLAIVALMLDFQKLDLVRFTSVRKQFEELLLRNDYLIQQIVRLRRGAAASVDAIKAFYLACINALDAGKSIEESVGEAVSSGRFGKQLVTGREEPVRIDNADQDFSRDVKSYVFLRTALSNASRCSICGSYLHVNAISIDHKVRKADGGLGSSENGQLAHPYCNTGYKERVSSQG